MNVIRIICILIGKTENKISGAIVIRACFPQYVIYHLIVIRKFKSQQKMWQNNQDDDKALILL